MHISHVCLKVKQLSTIINSDVLVELVLKASSVLLASFCYNWTSQVNDLHTMKHIWFWCTQLYKLIQRSLMPLRDMRRFPGHIVPTSLFVERYTSCSGC